MAGVQARTRWRLHAGSAAAMESESGVGSAGERDYRALVGRLPLMVVVFESNLRSTGEEKS